MSETIFEVLREDHDKQRTLVGLVEKTHGDSDGRRELFERLRAEAESHAAVEERVFYAALLAEETSRPKAGHSVEEHRQMERSFAELADADMSSPGWVQRFRQLADQLRHHLDEEEQEVFQLAGRVLDDGAKSALARQFRDAKPS